MRFPPRERPRFRFGGPGLFHVAARCRSPRGCPCSRWRGFGRSAGSVGSNTEVTTPSARSCRHAGTADPRDAAKAPNSPWRRTRSHRRGGRWCTHPVTSGAPLHHATNAHLEGSHDPTQPRREGVARVGGVVGPGARIGPERHSPCRPADRLCAERTDLRSGPSLARIPVRSCSWCAESARPGGARHRGSRRSRIRAFSANEEAEASLGQLPPIRAIGGSEAGPGITASVELPSPGLDSRLLP